MAASDAGPSSEAHADKSEYIVVQGGVCEQPHTCMHTLPCICIRHCHSLLFGHQQQQLPVLHMVDTLMLSGIRVVLAEMLSAQKFTGAALSMLLLQVATWHRRGPLEL